MAVSMLFALAFLVLCAFILLRSVQLVPEGHVRVVQRLGVQRRTLPAGLHLLVPIVDAPLGTYSEADIRSARIDVDARTSDQRLVRCLATARYVTSGDTDAPMDPTELANRIAGDAFARSSSSDVRSNTDDQLEHFLRSELDHAFIKHAMQVIDVRLTSLVRP